MNHENRKKFWTIINNTSRISGITLVVIFGFLVGTAQWYCRTIHDPHIARIADTVAVNRDRPILRAIDSMQCREHKKDSLSCLMFYVINEMATNDEKIRAKQKMDEARAHWK